MNSLTTLYFIIFFKKAFLYKGLGILVMYVHDILYLHTRCQFDIIVQTNYLVWLVDLCFSMYHQVIKVILVLTKVSQKEKQDHE